MDTDPELAVALGQLSSRRSSHALDPRSPQSFADRLKYLTLARSRFEALVASSDPSERAGLSPSKRLSVELYLDQLETYIDNAKFQVSLSSIVKECKGA